MSKLSNYIGYCILKRKKKKTVRETQVHNFKTARSAHIIFDASSAEHFPVIKDLRKYLKSFDIESRAIGLVNQKEVPSQLLFWDKFDYITRKEINWYKKPKGKVAESFLMDSPDILFDLTINPSLEVQFLVQLSKANFKIGCYTEEENDYDLMIRTDRKGDTRYFVDQIKHYVNMLNPS
ncbi:MAG: hypothetical protein JXR52_01265 [Bacteroidales bacterium]|nr:hypothetical protein [Bacteroidales bacterium]MBN2697426.1 hypothetical protein [Bacteroidales bacterium]